VFNQRFYVNEIVSIGQFWAAVWQVIGRVWVLDPTVFPAVRASASGTQLALCVLLLAGLSQTLGQSVALFANRVSKQGFVRAVLLSALVFTVSAALWAGSIWLIARLLFDLSSPFRHVLISVGLSYAPLVFGLFIFLPYFGNVLVQVLRIWVLLAAVVAIESSASLRIEQALLCVAIGWFAWHALSSYAGGGIERAIEAMERRLLGTVLRDTLDLSSEVARERERLRAMAALSGDEG
jgi:hypothetical protein